ncbi:MAG TPA: hypothetical protein VMM77_00160 [Gemmatimonadaceae bacterium]|nr:hypothetical protein [Gemmatimonadaceae bacterium]
MGPETALFGNPRLTDVIQTITTIRAPEALIDVAWGVVCDSLAVSAGPLDRPPPATMLEPAARVIRA